MAYRLVIFDFDGTLADTFPWFVRVVNDVADRYRFKRVAPHEVETLRGLGAREIMRHLGVPRWKLPLIAGHMRKRKAREIAQVGLFPGAGGILQTLATSGIRIALVSSNAEANVRAMLGPTNSALISYFECGASVFGKRVRFRRILRHSGISASDALCIGDEIRDADAAERTGIAFGAVAWGFTRPEALLALGPAEFFHRIDDIAERLCNLSKRPLPRAAESR
jgi:phosphoglycolate phosphatase